jgi:hypothetical protein
LIRIWAGKTVRLALLGRQNSFLVTLHEFLSCPYNLAFNRQTRMLADLSLVHCYNSGAMPKAERDRILLASAKANLKNMAFFGKDKKK